MLEYTYVCETIKVSITYLQQEWWQRADVATESKKRRIQNSKWRMSPHKDDA